MVWRRWIGILAVVGVLAHAAAVVRHHGSMLGDVLNPAVAALAADLSTICHFDPEDAGIGTTSPSHNGAKHCPLCSGLASAFALPPPSGWQIPEPPAAAGVYLVRPDQRVEQLKRIRPPGRGPPALA